MKTFPIIIVFIFFLRIASGQGKVTSDFFLKSLSIYSTVSIEQSRSLQLTNETNGDSIILKGNVKKNSNIIYCSIKIYTATDFQIVYYNSVGLSGNDFEIKIRKGTYSFYFREYQPGAIPIDFKNIKLQNDTTISFNYDPVPVPVNLTGIIQSISTSNSFLAAQNDSLRIFVKIDNTIPFDTIYYINEAQFPTEGKLKLKILLKDDGKNGDQVAHDGIYTSPYLNGFDNPYGDPISSAYINFFEILNFNNQNYFVSANAASISIPIADPAKIGDINIKQINDSIFMSDFVLNIVTSDISDENFKKITLKNLYSNRIIRDRFDFVNFFPCEFSTGNLLTNNHEIVQQKIQGIGDQLYNYSSLYGSKNILSGISVFPGISSSYPILHESMHQWGAYLDLFFTSEYGSHWGYSSVDGILGGFDPSGLDIINNSTVKINSIVADLGWQGSRGGTDADLELYLAGLLPFTQLRGTYYVLESPVSIGNNSYTVKSIKYITPQMIVDKYGERLPSFSNSQKSFNFLNIVLTKHPLNKAGFAFFEDQIRLLANDRYTGSLKEFSNNIGTANTRLKYDIKKNVQINKGENYRGYYSDATIIDSLVAVSGCDSIVTTYLKVILTTGSKEISDTNVVLYPIPVSKKLSISFLKPFYQPTVTIYSSDGIKVFSSKTNLTNFEVDMSIYPSGIYIVKIVTKDKFVITKKIIKL